MSLIREYRAEDVLQLEECFVELQDYERRLDDKLDDSRKVSKQYLEYLFARRDETGGKIFVAEVDGRVVGFISVWLRVKAKMIEEKEYEYAYVSDLVVVTGYRGHGVGRALLQKAEDYATLEGATVLRLRVLAKNEPARRLYKSLGYEERVIELNKRL